MVSTWLEMFGLFTIKSSWYFLTIIEPEWFPEVSLFFSPIRGLNSWFWLYKLELIWGFIKLLLMQALFKNEILLMLCSENESETPSKCSKFVTDYLTVISPCLFNLDFWKNVDFSPTFLEEKFFLAILTGESSSSNSKLVVYLPLVLISSSGNYTTSKFPAASLKVGGCRGTSCS